MWVEPKDVREILSQHHYLGPSRRGYAWWDEHGVIVFAKPTARHIPVEWLELSRWCIVDRSKNAGSRQWGVVRRALGHRFPDLTTLISYSDPSVGHTGALYRACNWWWAPTWLRLRPPPTGNGSWSGERSAVKDRWIFPLRPDATRAPRLVASDASILKRSPHLRYAEPGGVPFRYA